MTPTLFWVFLLALVGRATSVPRPLVVDACALLCNPGAETESERERDPVLFPRYPKVNCKLQSVSDEHQAWIIASHCLKLCNPDLSISSEVNCFAMRGSLQANLGCFCEALSPLSPNTMRLHESWRLNYLVKELASDILSVILSSPLDTYVLCDIHKELFNEVDVKSGKLYEKCIEDTANATTAEPERKKREIPDDTVDVRTKEKDDTQLPSAFKKLTGEEDIISPVTEELKEPKDLKDNSSKKTEEEKLRPPVPEEKLPSVEDQEPVNRDMFKIVQDGCKMICEKNKIFSNKLCNCDNVDNPELYTTDT